MAGNLHHREGVYAEHTKPAQHGVPQWMYYEVCGHFRSSRTFACGWSSDVTRICDLICSSQYSCANLRDAFRNPQHRLSEYRENLAARPY